MLFVNKVVGTQGFYATKDIQGFLKTIVLSSLAQVLGRELESVLDLAVRYDELATMTKARVFDEFASYGTELVDFVIEAITPPDEVQARIDERSGMAAVGDLDSYLRYKSALALGDAAQQPGGAGAVVDAGAGLGLGMALAASARQGTTPRSGDNPTHAIPSALTCLACAHEVPAGSKFCPECGTAVVANLCPRCHHQLTAAAKFCASCGQAAPTSGESA